ncbi:MAG: hypothetical protein WAW42_19295, partial [Candidatus Competibacteraceae bacterium]
LVCAITDPKRHDPRNPAYQNNPSINGKSIKPNEWRRLNSTALRAGVGGMNRCLVSSLPEIT